MIAFVMMCSGILGIISGIYEYTFLGNFLIFNIFFHFEYEKFNLWGLSSSTYRIFTICLLLTYLVKNFRTFDLSCLFKKKIELLVLALCSLVVCLAHYYLWNRWPSFYLSNQLKAFWPLIFLFFNSQPIHYEKILNYLGLVVASILVITSYPFLNAFNYGYISFWRIRERDLLMKLTPSFETNGKYFSFFNFDETSVLILTFSFIGLIYLIFHHERLKQHRGVQGVLVVFFSGYILLSQMLKSVVIWVVLIFSKILFFSRKTVIKKLGYAALISLGILTTICIADNKLMMIERFKIEEIDYAKEYNDYQRRLPRFLFTINKTFENPWRGAGFPLSFADDEVLPSGLRWRAASGHSFVIDSLFYFGFFWGSLAGVIVWLPFLLTLLSYKKLKNDSLKSYFYMSSTFSILVMAVTSIWGDSSVTLVITMYLLTLLFKENFTVE